MKRILQRVIFYLAGCQSMLNHMSDKISYYSNNVDELRRERDVLREEIHRLNRMLSESKDDRRKLYMDNHDLRMRIKMQNGLS